MPTDDSLIGREYYVFRDSTHNLIFVEDPHFGVLLRSILDTFEFQRMRRVRQTGLANLVYPSLEGSRFSHSLGSFAVGKRVIEALQEQQPDAKFGFPEALKIDTCAAHGFALASALHDIGHGPLSHSWEIIDEGLTFLSGDHVPHVHEQAGLDLVLSKDTEIGKLFAKHLARPESYEGLVLSACIAFLKKKHPLVYLRPLLAGNLDIDRLDFIARDTKNAGVTYGSHDVEWLIRSMRFGRLPRKIQDDIQGKAVGHRWVIAIDARKGLNALVQYLRARENMYGLVYLHKTVRAANWHLASILVYTAHLLRSGKILPDNNPLLRYLLTKQFSGSRGLLDLDDADVWYTIKQLRLYNDSFLSVLSSRFLSRQLYKSRQVSGNTASAIGKLLSNGGFANRIRGRLGAFPEMRDPAHCPDWLLCHLAARVDEVPFDVIGKEKDIEDETWIMYRRATDLGLLPLKEYWQKTVEEETAKTFHYVHFIDEIQSDMLEVIARLEGVFPQIEWAEDSSPEITEDDRKTAPADFEIRRALPDSGQHKRAYISVFIGQTSSQFNSGEPYVLKRYRDMSTQDAKQLADCVDQIYGIVSRNLSKTIPIRPEDGKPLWLVERLWVSDLLKLIKDTGKRLDLEFLLQMGADLFAGLAEMAKKNIRHGDVKLENAGVIDGSDGQLTFVLGDFGAASATPNDVPRTDGELGTLKTRPPELLAAPALRSIGLESDVWALAATVFGAALGRYPFMPLEYNHDERADLEIELSRNLDSRKSTLIADVNEQLPPALSEILGPCLLGEFGRRPSAAKVAEDFQTALSECRRPIVTGDGISTERKGLYWIRSLDLLDIESYASEVGLKNNNNLVECSRLAIDGKRWIPTSVVRAMEKAVAQRNNAP